MKTELHRGIEADQHGLLDCLHRMAAIDDLDRAIELNAIPDDLVNDNADRALSGRFASLTQSLKCGVARVAIDGDRDAPDFLEDLFQRQHVVDVSLPSHGIKQLSPSRVRVVLRAISQPGTRAVAFQHDHLARQPEDGIDGVAVLRAELAAGDANGRMTGDHIESNEAAVGDEAAPFGSERRRSRKAGWYARRPLPATPISEAALVALQSLDLSFAEGSSFR